MTPETPPNSPPTLTSTKSGNLDRRRLATELRAAGASFDAIGERLGMTKSGAWRLVHRPLQAAIVANVDAIREREGGKLDQAEAAIWPRVLEGELPAVDVFLRVAARRSRLFGLDAPVRVEGSMDRDALYALLQQRVREVVGRPAAIEGVVVE